MQTTIDIVDIFNGDVYFHVEQMIACTEKYSHKKHFYVIFLTDEELHERYVKFFSGINCSSYKIVQKRDHKIPLKIRLLLLFAGTIPYYMNDLIFTLLDFQKYKMVAHGLMPKIFHYFVVISGLKDINFICWGNIPRRTSIFRGMLSYCFWFTVFHKYKRIFCLMQPDVIEIQKRFKCSAVMLCPYPQSSIFSSQDKRTTRTSLKYNILVGNTAEMIKDYASYAKKIQPFSKDIESTFMMNYGSKYDLSQIPNFEAKLQSTNIKFNLWKKVVPFEDYVKTVSQYDIYYCEHMTQTGLGIIYTMLLLKKTIFLNGYNLDWLLFLGFKIDSTDTMFEKLKNNGDLLISDQNAEYNRSLFIEIFSPAHRCEMNEKALFWDLNIPYSSTQFL